ncbi:aquaporin-7 isoform X6 [Balaenoptera musculus]|uniref:Aquaporin-7 isoform X6 n=1 Tax=Balaenoptera musculus TaxID=9771 RepID=A0A8B8XZ56_BALMU|nr:aquaporin-7 isoform X6 [Balaenoptera musculus]
MTQADRKKRSTRMSKMVTPPAVTRMKAVLQKEMVREFLAEFLSTFVMMVFGLGAIAHMVLGDKMGSYLGVNLGFGFGVTMGVHMAGNISGAHMNAALTFTNCALGRMSWKKFPVYVLGQFLGSFLAAATIYCLFYSVSDRDASAVSLSHHGQGEQPSTARDTGLGDRHPCCHHWSVHGHELRICHQPLPGPASTLLHLIAGWGTQVFRVLPSPAHSSPRTVVGASGGPPLGAYLGAIIYLIFIGSSIQQEPQILENSLDV